MNIKKIEERKEQLMQQKKAMLNNIIAIDGAIQDCDFWLKELKRKDIKKVKE